MKSILAAALLAATITATFPAEAATIETAASDEGSLLPVTGVATPQDLVALLTTQGYSVDVVTRDGDGNLLFRVGPPGNGEPFVLLVDGRNGSILLGQPPQGASQRHRRPWPGPFEAIRNDPVAA